MVGVRKHRSDRGIAVRPAATLRATAAFAVLALGLHAPAHASFLSGEALDTAADVIAWVALVIVPVVGIVGFWLVHILPEKIAEQKRHPQAKAIQVLCLLSLVFGGMLWPIAWLWAYSKPVLHKMAYGTDVGEHEAPSESGEAPDGTLPVLTAEAEVPVHARQAQPARAAKQGG